MKKIVSAIFALIFLYALAHSSVLAVEQEDERFVSVGGVQLTDGAYLANGASTATSTKPASGGYAHYENGVLTLHNYEYVGEGTWSVLDPSHHDMCDHECACIYSWGGITIVLEGDSSVENPDSMGYGIWVHGSVTVIGGEGDTLSAKGNSGIFVYALETDAALTLNGGTVYAFGSYTGLQVAALGHQGYSDLVVDGATLYADSDNYGMIIGGIAKDVARLILKSGEVYTEGGHDGIIVWGNDGSEIHIEAGIFEASSEEHSAVQMQCEEQECLFEQLGGEVKLKGATFAIYSENVKLNGDKFTASSNHFPKGWIYPLFESGTKLETSMTVIDGSFDESSKSVVAVKPSGRGDVNFDGAVNQYDYILVKRHYFGTRTLTRAEMSPADANYDGEVNQYDYILIKRHYFGTFTII